MTTRYIPTLITTLSQITQITASMHSIVLNQNGDVFSFGDNSVI
jgi:hypothetical protein